MSVCPEPSRFERSYFESAMSGMSVSGPDDEGPPLLQPHGLSLVSLLAAAVISFFFLVFAFFALVPLFFELIDGDAIGPLILPIYIFNHYVEALIGSMIFT